MEHAVVVVSPQVRWFFVLGTFLTAAPAVAHDSWLVGPRQVPLGEEIRAAFNTGEVFPLGEKATKPERVASWVVVDEVGRRSVERFGVEGTELVARVAPRTDGAHVVGVILHPHFIEIEAARFDDYLRGEHAGEALALRKQGGEASVPGREYYTKAAKAVVFVGESATDKTHATLQTPVGHPLEIIPISSPGEWRVGASGAFRVLHHGRPAAGLRLAAGHEELPEHTFASTDLTDGQGVARISFTRPGRWFVRTHTIQRREPASSGSPNTPTVPDADWESDWASLTFFVAE